MESVPCKSTYFVVVQEEEVNMEIKKEEQDEIPFDQINRCEKETQLRHVVNSFKSEQRNATNVDNDDEKMKRRRELKAFYERERRSKLKITEEQLEQKRLSERRRRANMTEEQLEQRRLSERRRRANMTQEQRERRAASDKRRKQLMRTMRRLARGEMVEDITEEQKVKILKRLEKKQETDLCRDAKSIGSNPGKTTTDEQHANGIELNELVAAIQKRQEELKQQRIIRKITKEAEMSDEEKEKLWAARYFRRHAWLATLSREEKADMSKRQSQWRKRWWAEMPEEEKRRKMNHWLEWKKSLTGEKKQRHDESVRRAVRKSQAKQRELLKLNPELAKKEGTNLWKKRKHTEQVYNRILEYQRQKTAVETPEERQKRLNRCKVNSAKRKLKKELTEEGLPTEEIEQRLKILGEKLWAELATREVSTEYKPRLKGRKPRKYVLCSSDSPETPVIDNDVTEMPSVEEEIAVEIIASQTECCESVVFSEQKGLHQIADNTDKDMLPSNISCPNSVPSPGPDPVTNEEEDDDLMDYAPASPVEFHTTPPPSPTLCSPLPVASSPSPQQIEYFSCKYCSTSTFPSDEALRDHIRTSHFSTCWKCPKCKQVMLSPQELSEHFKTSHQSSNFICMRCPWSKENKIFFKTHQELFQHVEREHKESFWPCPNTKCKLLKYSQKSLQVHIPLCCYSSK